MTDSQKRIDWSELGSAALLLADYATSAPHGAAFTLLIGFLVGGMALEAV